MVSFVDLLVQSFEKVLVSFSHNWYYLLISVLISVGLRLYTNPEKVGAFIMRYRRVGIVGATAAAVATPLCSCGTTAVILGMVASTMSWAPIVAFMVSSPLSSPEGLFYSAGIFGWPFAIAFYISSIILGLLGGVVAEFFESRGWLANQARFAQPAQQAAVAVEQQKPIPAVAASACACQPAQPVLAQPVGIRITRNNRPVMVTSFAALSPNCCGSTSTPVAEADDCSCAAVPVTAAPAAPSSCGCSGSPAKEEQPAQPAAKPQKVTLRQWLEESYKTGKQLLVMFLGFAFIGYVLNGLIPPAWIDAIFGKGNVYSIPLAATLGLPLYINSEGSLPLVRALIDGGMSQGAALAFLITGAGTSMGAITGALTIARWRVIGLVIGTLWVGSVVLGYLYDLLLAMHLF